MTQGLLWLPLLLVFVLLTGLGWLERRRQQRIVLVKPVRHAEVLAQPPQGFGILRKYRES